MRKEMLKPGEVVFELRMPLHVREMVKKACKKDLQSGNMTRFIWMAAEREAQRILDDKASEGCA